MEPEYDRANSGFEAIIEGSRSGVTAILNITALLISVLGLVALVDMALAWTGGHVGGWLGLELDLTLRTLFGYLFYPLTLVIGIPPDDAFTVSRIVGERLVVTEVASYTDLAAALEQGALNHPRSAVVAAYALCGFAHVASMAIFVGGLTAIVPDRTRTIAGVGPRALLAATLACLLTACTAGTFFRKDVSILAPRNHTRAKTTAKTGQ